MADTQVPMDCVLLEVLQGYKHFTVITLDLVDNPCWLLKVSNILANTAIFIFRVNVCGEGGVKKLL